MAQINPRADRSLSARLARAVKSLAQRPGAVTGDDRDQAQVVRREVREALIPKEDLFGLERLIGKSDLVGIDFLARAMRAARSICRIRIDDGRGNRDLATGFLVAPNTLLTNHHVLPSLETAQYAQAEFEYENDINYVPKMHRTFPLAPSTLFYADADFDFTFVAVVPAATDGTPLSDYGWLPLIRASGKALNGEWVSIIQHPKGERKQIVLRENRVVMLPPGQNFDGSENYMHYTADTERGSSGSAVFNDQFDVVALHHRGVGRLDKNGRPLTRDGKLWTEDMGEDQRDWIANEGVRISSIYQALESGTENDDAQQVLRRLRNIPQKRFPTPGIVIASPEIDAPEGTASLPSNFAGRKGYDPEFLPGLKIPLPKLSAAAKADAAPVVGGGNVLDYTHFSLVISKSRRLARYTAVNIDGELRKAPTKNPTWRADGRVDEKFQSTNDLYKAGLHESVDLQRGHLVRRLDPVWGKKLPEADQAVGDTYHYTNAAPQAAVFNDQIWGNLEDYILQRAEDKNRKVTVFTGPVFLPTDRLFGPNRPGGPYKIPAGFWKVVAFIKPGSTPAATAFVLDQTPQIGSLFEGFSPMSEQELRKSQVKIEHIEELAGLDFGALKKHDRFALIESLSAVSEVRSFSDIQL